MWSQSPESAQIKKAALLKEVKKAHENAQRVISDETGVKLLLDKVRKLYYDYRMVGEIQVTKMGLFESSLSCEVDGTGEYFKDLDTNEVKINKFVDSIAAEVITIISFGVDKMLNDIMYRSKQYWEKSYRDDMTLSGTFTFEEPNGIFSMSIQCSATVKSMHDNYFKQNEFELTYGFPLDKDTGIFVFR